MTTATSGFHRPSLCSVTLANLGSGWAVLSATSRGQHWLEDPEVQPLLRDPKYNQGILGLVLKGKEEWVRKARVAFDGDAVIHTSENDGKCAKDGMSDSLLLADSPRGPEQDEGSPRRGNYLQISASKCSIAGSLRDAHENGDALSETVLTSQNLVQIRPLFGKTTEIYHRNKQCSGLGAWLSGKDVKNRQQKHPRA